MGNKKMKFKIGISETSTIGVEISGKDCCIKIKASKLGLTQQQVALYRILSRNSINDSVINYCDLNNCKVYIEAESLCIYRLPHDHFLTALEFAVTEALEMIRFVNDESNAETQRERIVASINALYLEVNKLKERLVEFDKGNRYY